MGEQYSRKLEDKIRSLGSADVRVFVDGSLSPHYRRHVEETVVRAGATVVSDESQANFIVTETKCEALSLDGHVVALVHEGQLTFSGHI
jgi:hypothetical protein